MRKITLFLVTLAISVSTMAVGGLSGTYKVGTGEVAPNFALLSEAVTAINTQGLAGDVILEITSDITEPANIGLAKVFGAHTLTIRPSADEDRTITFTQSGDNGASSGNFVLGLASVNDWTTIGVVENVTIDGYAVGGNTRRLKFVNVSTNNNTCKPIHIIGNANNIVVKNCILIDNTSGTSAFGVVTIRVRNSSSIDYIPNNITIDNNEIKSISSTAAGIFVSNSGTPVGRPDGLLFKNNNIDVRHRGISLNYSGTSIVDNNTIKVNQPASGMASFGIGGTSAGLVLTTISNNRLIQLTTGNIAGGTNGIRGIQASAGGTWNIFNNFITGFGTPTTGTTEVLGIRAGVASNIYNNTIVLNNVTTTGPGTTPVSCIVNYGSATNIKNNILIVEEDDFAAYGIYASSGITSSDYNIIYRTGTNNANIGFSAATNRATLDDWKTANSSLDINSQSVPVNFVDAAAGDLRIAGLSIQDNMLAVPRLPEVLKDMFGTDRAEITYAGAHQSTLPFVVSAVEAPASQQRIARTATGILIELDRTANIEIYTVNGMLIERARTNNYSRDLNNGIYIIRIDGVATKFVK